MGYDAELWACYSKVKFPQNRGRTTKKEKGSLQIREVYLQSLNQHTGEVKLEVDETLKDLDVFKSPLKIKNKKRKRKKKEKKKQNGKASKVLPGLISTDSLVKRCHKRKNEKIKEHP